MDKFLILDSNQFEQVAKGFICRNDRNGENNFKYFERPEKYPCLVFVCSYLDESMPYRENTYCYNLGFAYPEDFNVN